MSSSTVPSRASTTLLLLFSVFTLHSCKPKTSIPEASLPDGALVKVGTITITSSDLEYRLSEHYNGRTDDASRQHALKELVKRAQFTQAALDGGLADDPIIRDEVSRLLATRLRERDLAPGINQQLEVTEERLRELYLEQADRFQAPEKRQVAVLWLNSGSDPRKAEQHAQKLRIARDFIANSKDLTDHPEKGFSSLSADYSEHHASRYRGGVVGWLQSEGGMDSWTKAVAKIVFKLKDKGAVSDVTTTPEGVFLVRLIDLQPAVTRPFDSVSSELERTERNRLRNQLDETFDKEIESRYPAQWSGNQ